MTEQMREELERLRAALRDCAQKAEALKMPCGDDPESAQAVRNARYQAISSVAHLALGTIKGPEMYVTREELALAVEAAFKEAANALDVNWNYNLWLNSNARESQTDV